MLMCKKKRGKKFPAVMVSSDVTICSLVGMSYILFQRAYCLHVQHRIKMEAINSYKALTLLCHTAHCHISVDCDPGTAVTASNLMQVTNAWLGDINAHFLHSTGEAPVSTDTECT
jgi:hypothetical protein